MGSTTGDPRPDEARREQAAAWLARVRGGAMEDHRAFEEWYQADPRHAAAYDALLDNWEITERIGETPLAQARRNLARAPRRWRYVVAAAAATVAIILLAFGAYGAVIGGHDRARPTEFASRSGEIRTLRLPDGSHVTLDSASLLKIGYSPEERRVLLSRGRARFVVAHDNARPFVVATGAGLVIAHGTVFDVAVDGQNATVSLIEGSIEVRSPKRSGRRPSFRMLSAGQRVVLRGGEVPPPTPWNEADWLPAMISFEDAPLGEVIAAANKSAARRIVLSDPALTQLRFTGTFRTGDPDALARMIAAAFDLRLSHAPDHSLVLARAREGTERSKKIPG